MSLFQGPKRRCQVSYRGKAGEAIHAADDLPAAGWHWAMGILHQTCNSDTSLSHQKFPACFLPNLQNLSPQTIFFRLGSAQLNPATNFQGPNQAYGVLHLDPLSPLRLTLRHVARLRHRDRYVPRRHRRWWRWYHPPVKGNPANPTPKKSEVVFPTLAKGAFLLMAKISWICGFGKMNKKHDVIMTRISLALVWLPRGFGVDCLH